MTRLDRVTCVVLGLVLAAAARGAGTPVAGPAPSASGAGGGRMAPALLRGPLATLSSERLARPYASFAFSGVSQAAAERLLAGAVAGVYAEVGGRLVMLASSACATRERLAALLADAPGKAAGALPTPDAERVTNLVDFAAELDRLLPGLDSGAWGRYLVRMPIEVEAPPGLGQTSQVPGPPASPNATVFSEGFESGISSAVWQLQSPDPRWTWGATTCSGPGTGTKSADAVRGGTTPPACDDIYPINQFNWMYHKSCENFSGAAQAWLKLSIAVWTTNTQADSLSVLFRNPTGTRFVGFWHAGTWKPAWTFYYNLKQWEGIGDLTASNCNHLTFIFMSDDDVVPPPPGFGARVDDILIFTGSNPTPSCSVAADVRWGAAPLTVHFTGTWAGGGGQTYNWSFNDGGSSSSLSPTHVFSTPGDYDPYFEVLFPTGDKCLASLHVTAHGGGDDICSGATAITANSANVFSTEGYTRDSGVPATPCSTDDGAIGATRWFKFTATKPGYGAADLCGSAPLPTEQPYLTFFKGSCGALTWLHCYDTTATCGGTPPPAVPMQPGELFYFQVARLDDVGADAKLNFAFAECTVACTATVPPTGTVGVPVSFAAGSTPTNCPLPAATYAWTWGDGKPPSTSQNPQHAYTTAGPFNWSMTATINGVTCQKNGSITISALPKGDGNGDGTVNVADVFYLINALFAGGPSPIGPGDVNADGVVNVADVFYLINYLFAGGPAPV